MSLLNLPYRKILVRDYQYPILIGSRKSYVRSYWLMDRKTTENPWVFRECIRNEKTLASALKLAGETQAEPSLPYHCWLFLTYVQKCMQW